MSLTLSLLPLYVTGNLHCLGMCGPLVHTLSLHRFKYYYLLGRICSYTLAGGISGALGFLASFGGFATLSIFIGLILIVLAFNQIYPIHFKWRTPNFISLIMRDTPLIGIFIWRFDSFSSLRPNPNCICGACLERLLLDRKPKWLFICPSHISFPCSCNENQTLASKKRKNRESNRIHNLVCYRSD